MININDRDKLASSGREDHGRTRFSGANWLTSLLLVGAVSACGGGGGPGNDATAESLAAMAAVAAAARPGGAASCSFEHVYVTVQSVRVQLDGGGQQWTDIALASPKRIDLLNLSGGLLQALGAAPLASGTYTAVQLVLLESDGANQVQPSGGSLASLQVEGSPQNGLTIKGNLIVPSGQFGDLALQGFDPCQSIIQAGSPSAPRYQLKPQLGVTASVVAAAIQRVNTRTAGPQFDASVSRMPDGGYIVVWRDPTFTLPGSGLPVQQLCWQRYAVDATRVGGELCHQSGDFANLPQVLGLPDGGYVVTWVSSDTSGLGIWTVQVRPDGFVDEFAHFANALQAGEQTEPATALLSGGGYVITWRSGADIYARRFDAHGAALGTEQIVNTYTGTGLRSRPAVAGLSDGSYVVTWMSTLQDAARNSGIYMQRFSANGTPLGAETLLTAGSDSGRDPAIAALAGGGFVVTWVSLSDQGATVVAQQFTAAGAASGAQATVNEVVPLTISCSLGTCLDEIPHEPAVAGLDDGGYVITWFSEFRTRLGADGVYARRYAADGTEAGPATVVALGGTRPAVSGSGGDGFVIVWDAWNGAANDVDVFARNYGSGGLMGAAVP